MKFEFGPCNEREDYHAFLAKEVFEVHLELDDGFVLKVVATSIDGEQLPL